MRKFKPNTSAFKMNGSGKVYYEGSGDPINLNPNDLIEGKGPDERDEYGNKQYIHKKTGDIFYKDKPRGESPWEKLKAPGSDKIIIPPRNFA